MKYGRVYHLLSWKKNIGGIYDNRFLVKPVKIARTMMPNANMEVPYEGAKEILLVDELENKDLKNSNKT